MLDHISSQHYLKSRFCDRPRAYKCTHTNLCLTKIVKPSKYRHTNGLLVVVGDFMVETGVLEKRERKRKYQYHILKRAIFTNYFNDPPTASIDCCGSNYSPLSEKEREIWQQKGARQFRRQQKHTTLLDT